MFDFNIIVDIWFMWLCCNIGYMVVSSHSICYWMSLVFNFMLVSRQNELTRPNRKLTSRLYADNYGDYAVA